MAFCIALAVRDLHMTVDEARGRGHGRGRRARCGATTSAVWSPGAAADLVVLDAPSYRHLVYRPGVPLIHATIVKGRALPTLPT